MEANLTRLQEHLKEGERIIAAYDKGQADIKAKQEFLSNYDIVALKVQNDTLADDYASTASKIERLEITLREENASRTRAKNEHDCKLKFDKASDAVRTLAAVIKLLEEAQRTIIKRSIGPLLSDAQLFLEGILPVKLAFENNTFGYWSDGWFVDHEVASESEQALIYGGLSIALAAQGSPCRIAIIDEMSRFDRVHNKRLVLERMNNLTSSGKVDHIFAMDTDIEFYEPYKGLDWIQLYHV
jgi:hypothetical protein